MIDPHEIPEFTGDLAALATDIKGLNGNAGKIRGTGQKVHTDFQGLSAYYHAPEAEQLFATTKPVQDRADQFAGKLEKVTAALDAYSTEVRPIIAKLKQLRIDAAAFVKECGHGDHWKYDGGKVKRNNSLMHDVAAATAAFWDAERRAANAITALVGGTHWTTDDGSHKPGMYGYKADDLEHAQKTPWGSQDSQKHHLYDVGHWVKAFVWDGLIVDGAWSTLKGLGTLVGFGGWESFKQSWTGLGHLAVGLGASSLLGPAGLPLLLMTPDKALPGFLKDGKHAVINAGKSMVAWDEWGKNPGRAAGAVTFNVLTAVATDGAGDAAKAGSVAKAISIAGKGGRLIDPMTYVMKGAGLGLTKLKVGDMLGNLKNLHAGTDIKLPDGTVRLPDGSLPHPDGTVHVPDDVPVHTVPADPVHVPDGVPRHAGPSVHVPEGTPAHPAGPAHVPHEGAAHPGDPDSSAGAPHESAPHAPAPHPAGSVRMPGGDVLHPDGTLVKPDGTIDHTVPSEMSAADRQALADAGHDLHQPATTLVHAGGTPAHEVGRVGDPVGVHDPGGVHEPGGVRASNDPPAGGGGGGGPHDPPTHNPPVHTGPTHDPAPPAHPGGGGSHPGGGGGHSGGETGGGGGGGHESGSHGGGDQGGHGHEPKPELTPAERAEQDTHLQQVEQGNKADFDVLKQDPDHRGKIKPSEMDEARVALDMREQGTLPSDIQRPPEANQGDLYSPSNGEYYDIKGVHSDWPPLNNVRDKSLPFKGAYDPANNQKWVEKLRDQIIDRHRMVVIDTRNADQAAIDDVRAIVEDNGLEDRVVWYP